MTGFIFQDRRFQPLTHSSAYNSNALWELGGRFWLLETRSFIPAWARGFASLGYSDRARTSQGIIKDIQIAENWKNKGMMDSDAVGKSPLHNRNDGATHDRHDQQPGAVAGQRPQLGNAQGKNAREHDRVEKSH